MLTTDLAENVGNTLHPTMAIQKSPNPAVIDRAFSYTARTRARKRKAVALAMAASSMPSNINMA